MYAEILVAAPRLRKLLADLDYDFIILDTPPGSLVLRSPAP